MERLHKAISANAAEPSETSSQEQSDDLAP
jgi:hypothetical protein